MTGLLVSLAVVVLSLVGAGAYRALPLTTSDESRARSVVEDFVAAWADGRCEDAAALVDTTADQAEQACRDSVARRRGTLRLEEARLRLDGSRGTADLQVALDDGTSVERHSVSQELVRRQGRWRVDWR